MNDQHIAAPAGEPSDGAAATAPIAIVGLACRFPGGANNPEAFWQLLVDGGDAIRPIKRDGLELARFYDPKPRTPGRMMTRWGGFLDDLELFDAAFFGVSPREAASVDPAQRLLLEAAWEACEDAAIDPSTLAGEPVGVFVGQWLSDFEGRLFADPDQVDFHATTGSGRYASSGRVSFFLGAIGPSITVDTACSSSLVAVHLACQSLRAHESTMAIAAGVNVILQPHISIAYSQSGMMAADGHCKFGDANGDGYVRSEGVGLVLLKPLAAALADGDPIRAVIRGSAVNNDGRGSGHMATPSRSGQAAMLRAAYANASVAPERVRYVEAHGTGTRAGDPVELGALSDVLAPGRPPQARCLVGSVKTNIGHTEGAAGMAGLLKCVLALQHSEVPPSLHLREPNPAIPWGELPFDVPQERVAWPPENRPRLAGVSAFGITGTNAHVVLEERPARVPARSSGEDAALPLILSAATPRALEALAASYADLLESAASSSLRDVCATAARHRAALEHRAVFVADGPAELAERLRRFAAGDSEAADAVGRAETASPRRVAFVFPGQGGQWVGMARELLVHEPAFREAIERCDAARPDGLGWTIGEQLFADPSSPSYRLDEIGVLQPTLLAVEIALALLWRSWGVTPEAVVGHSMGEVGAAHVAGALSLDEAMLVICARSALMQRTSGAGAMAVLELSIADTTERIAPNADRLCVAVSNGPRSTVVSGDPDAVAELLAGCEREGIFGRAVKVDVASHSAQMDPLVPELLAGLHDLSPRSTDTTLYSTVDAAERQGDRWDAAYWARNLRQPVLFAATVDHMLADGIDTVIEVGPHPTLLVSLAQAGGTTARPLLTLASLRRKEPERASLLASLGALWAAGHPVAWQALLPSDTYNRVPLPHYPWQRERHWSDAALPVPPEGTSRRRPPLDEVIQRWIHRPRWDCAPLSDAAATVAGRWLLVGPAESELAALRGALEQRGGTVHAVASVEHAAQWIGRMTPAERGELGVVLLPAPTVSAFDGAIAAVRALQADWPESPSSRTPRLWWVTRGAHVVREETPSEWAGEQAALWGAARVISVEHPDWWGGLADLDPNTPTAEQAEALAGHLCADDHEDQVAIRDGERYVLRVVPVEPVAGLGMQGYPWRADAAYLITGGLGGVAREIASSMVRDGARRLVLLSRSPLPPRTTWATVPEDTEVGRRIKTVRELEHAGASVHLVQADVADESQVRAALGAYAAAGWPPIAGVIHTAAVLDNQLTTELDRETFDRVLSPKLAGALVLDRLLPTLDLFVVFSSISAFWAPAGMANYAAANAGLDALAQVRRTRGQHALSIQWGPWSNVGLHEHAIAARSMEALEREGVGAFPAEQGTALFTALLSETEPVVAVLPIDWPTFRRAWRGRDVALFRSAPYADGGDSGAALATDGIMQRLQEASPVDRQALLEAIVREAVGRVLRLPPAELDARRPFGALGLDSLMALELRNRLETAVERSLSATLAWNYPTVEVLAAHLDALLAPEPAAPDPESQEPSAAPRDEVELDRLMVDLSALSDDEATHALRGGR